MRDQFANVFYDEAMCDHRLVMVVADISPAGSMAKFREKSPERFINVGVSEQIMVGMSAGLALRGFRPFTYTIATFSLYRPFEFIRDDLAYQNLPVTIVGMGAGIVYSTLGSTHNAFEDIAIAAAVPNMTVIAPCDPEETKYATQWCARESAGPVYLRIGKAGEPNYTEHAVDPFIFGKMRTVCKGNDTCILTYGPTGIKMAFNLKDQYLQHQSVSIVSCHTIKPLDLEGLKTAFETHHRVIVIEEHAPHGGLSSRVKEFAWDNKMKTPLHCFTLKDHFFHYYGSHDGLLRQHGLAPDLISTHLESINE